jgi:DNA-binding response OmpR family regulator
MASSESHGERKLKILVVEDDNDLQKILKISLKNEGFEVLQAYSGTECFKVLKLQHPDLILLDLMMPDMDGFETCKRLKSMDSTSEIPVIILTVQEALQSKLKCFSFKADDYIVKPYEFDDLLARIYLHLNKMVETQESRKKERARTLRSTMKSLSEEIREAYAIVDRETGALEMKLPPGSRTDLDTLKSAHLELVRVVERMREQVDPFYESPFLEKVR